MYLRNGGGWADDGCRASFMNEIVIECECNHLTNFAVLIGVREIVSMVFLPNIQYATNLSIRNTLVIIQESSSCNKFPNVRSHSSRPWHQYKFKW